MIMALQKYSDEQIEKMSMIELANLILGEHKQNLHFKELFDKVADVKKFTEAQKGDLLSRFYTDLNVDGRFTALGGNVWGLKRWYKVDQTSEKSLAETRKRDKEEEELEEEYEEYLEEDLDEDVDLEEDEGEDVEKDNEVFGQYEELGFDKIEED